MDFSEFHSADFRKFVQDHLNEDPALLLFRYQGKVSFDLKMAVQQIGARQRVVKKLSAWSADPQLLFPATISLEQSSSEETAKFKSEGMHGKRMIDLTGGFGVDFFYLSQGFELGIYCEKQAELFEIARHNLELLGPGKFQFVEGDGLEYLKTTPLHFDLIYADPARRGISNQKLYKLQDCEPNVVRAWELLKSKTDRILLKVAPMLDISQAWGELPDIQKITIVSVKNEVKELLLSWEKGKENTPKRIEAVDLGSNFPSFEFGPEEEEKANSQFGEAETYLFEPLSGILKAGAFQLFGERFGLKKLEKNSHLYTGSQIPEDIPARVFEVMQEIPPKKQVMKALFPSGKANVICRNYITGAEDLKKKLGLKDGGEDYLIGTKSGREYKVYWCHRLK